MSCGSDNDPGKRVANAAERAISEVKAKVHGTGEGDSSDSSDGTLARAFCYCLVRKSVGFHLKFRRIVGGQQNTMQMSAVLASVCGPLPGVSVVLYTR